MDNIYIIVLIVIPISMFGTGFLIARQLRPLENVPLFSMMFVQRRLLFSFVMGFLMSFMFMAIFGYITGFSSLLFLGFVGISLLATLCYYFGVTLGWGTSSSALEATTHLTNQTQIDTTFPDNLTVDDLFTSVKITINSKKRWVFFAMEAFQWIIMGLCILPIAGFALISFLQDYLPQSLRFLVWVLVAGLILYLLYTKFMEVLEFVFDKEIIEIDHEAVRIEKYGLRFSSKKEYSAENIKQITGMFSFAGTNTAIKRSPFANTNMPAFMMWHNRGLKRYRTFGRAIDLSDAQRILAIVYAKFPQYKG